MDLEEAVRELIKDVQSLNVNVIPPISQEVEKLNKAVAELANKLDEVEAKLDQHLGG